MRRSAGVLAAAAAVALMGGAPAHAALKAGAGVVDATWHVGASAGQYASSPEPLGQEIDPFAHQTLKKQSYGVQSRLSARALVLQEGAQKVAIVKIDLYIPQDLLWRRAAQILEQRGTGIGRSNLVVSVTHDHSSPFYTSTSWGAWAFQDVLDVRAFEYYARAIADAVTKANARLVPARVAAATAPVAGPNRNALGAALGHDGTPAGFPDSYTDRDLVLLRVDDVSDPERPRPLGNLVNFAIHPEGLSGNDLISADFVGAFERMLDRSTGAVTVWTQGSVGNSEDERNTYHSVHERLFFDHREYGQAEWNARVLADVAEDLFAQALTPAAPVRPMTTGPLMMIDRWFPGPLTHPYPAVSSCRTDQVFVGNPQLPVIGLPDCTNPFKEIGIDPFELLPSDPGITAESFKRLGIPLPDNYGFPSYTGLEEDVSVHLQAIRIGEILITTCSCEQWADQSENIETRTDKVPLNDFAGFDWATYRGLDDTGVECFELRPFDSSRWNCPHPETAQTTPCFQQADGTWSCPDPRTECQLKGASLTNTCGDAEHRPDLRDSRITVPEDRFERMVAQVRNCANGWNSIAWAPYAESEPVDPALIKGNFTCDDGARSAALGYGLTIPMAMTNDYNGYIASYREYQRGDHYRKALTGWGPHSSDYMSTRLVQMGRRLHGGPTVGTLLDGRRDPDGDLKALVLKTSADMVLNNQKAAALGTVAGLATKLYETVLPNDGGTAAVIRQPADTQRFGAARFTWNGGSNYTDNPVVRVERLVGEAWRTYAEQDGGEVVTTVRFPASVGDLPAFATGNQRWEWTAHFEPFVARYDLRDRPRATPAGTYRFVVDGHRRALRKRVAYRLVSRSFAVRPWAGVTAEDVRVDEDGTASLRVGPRTTVSVPGGNPQTTVLGPIDYPDSYSGGARFIRNQRTLVRDPGAPGDPGKFEWYCLTCSFRPWLDTGDAVAVTVTTAGGGRLPATPGPDGRWHTAAPAGSAPVVCPGDVVDAYGNHNGKAHGPGDAAICT